MARSLGVLVDHQARRSQLPHESREAVARRPVLAMALQHGAGGEEVVTSLARSWRSTSSIDEIVRQIAESTHLSERVVSTLTHCTRRRTADWLESLASHDFLSSTEYRHQLTRVVGAIAHHGGRDHPRRRSAPGSRRRRGAARAARRPAGRACRGGDARGGARRADGAARVVEVEAARQAGARAPLPCRPGRSDALRPGGEHGAPGSPGQRRRDPGGRRAAARPPRATRRRRRRIDGATAAA